MSLTELNFALESYSQKSPIKAKEVNQGPGFFLEIGTQVKDYTDVDSSELFKIVPLSDTDFLFKSVKFGKFLKLSSLHEFPFKGNQAYAATLEETPTSNPSPDFIFSATHMGDGLFIFKSKSSDLFLAVYNLGMDVGGLDSRLVLSLEESKTSTPKEDRYLFKIYNEKHRSYLSYAQLSSMYKGDPSPTPQPTPTPAPQPSPVGPPSVMPRPKPGPPSMMPPVPSKSKMSGTKIGFIVGGSVILLILLILLFIYLKKNKFFNKRR
jgi:hypothetical protein